MSKLSQSGKILSLSLYSAMLLSFCLWQLVRPSGPSYLFWAVQTVPLLIFIPGLKNNNPRAYIGLCFVLLLYFIKGVEGVFHPAPAWVDISTLAFSVSLFISAMMTSRWLQADRRAGS